MAFGNRFPIRIIILFLMFISRFLIQCVAANLFFCLHLMTFPEKKDIIAYCIRKAKNSSEVGPVLSQVLTDYGPRYNWTAQHKLFIVESYTIGFMTSSIPAGLVAEFLGPLNTILYCTAMGSIINILRVFCAVSHWQTLMWLEFFLGLNLGLFTPALMLWIARWAPPNERGMFVCATTGRALGIAWIGMETKFLGKYIGWKGTFYFNSGRALLFCIALFFLGSNAPETHPSISEKELRYIKRSQKGKVTLTKSVPPYGRILNSKAFWSANIIGIGFGWGTTLQFRVIPQYLTEFIGFSYDQVMWLEAFPYLGFIGTGLLSGAIGDYLRRKSLFSNDVVMKTWMLFSHIMPGAFLLIMPMAYCNSTIAFVLLFAGVTFIGTATLCVQRTGIDIAPNYSGTIAGFLQFSTRSTDIAIFLINHQILNFNHGVIGYTIIFLIGGCCLIGTAVIFIFLGSAGCQWWNQKSQDIHYNPRFYDDKNTPSSPISGHVQPKEQADTRRIKDNEKNKDKNVSSSPNSTLQENVQPKREANTNRIKENEKNEDKSILSSPNPTLQENVQPKEQAHTSRINDNERSKDKTPSALAIAENEINVQPKIEEDTFISYKKYVLFQYIFSVSLDENMSSLSDPEKQDDVPGKPSKSPDATDDNNRTSENQDNEQQPKQIETGVPGNTITDKEFDFG